MDDDDQKDGGGDDGAPAWVMTFADLMSLLLTFFVLLLSFAEMDVKRYRQIAGSLQAAFGVQRRIEAESIPRGTSIIAQEFSPGRPQPTPINEIRQVTADDSQSTLDVRDLAAEQAEQLAKDLEDVLQGEISQGLVSIEAEDEEVHIRIRERGSFQSGSASLQVGFSPVMRRIASVLTNVDGQIVVEGHTDDIPISTPQFPSNWMLSSARAANVVQSLINDGIIDGERLEIRAHADTKPLVPNDSSENRAQNRRVEIVVRQRRGANDFESLEGDSVEVETQSLDGSAPPPDDTDNQS